MASPPTPHQEHHPGAREYIMIAVFLTIITSVEVAVYYVEALEDFLVYILLTLSAVKFVVVVGWYMHLKFDNRIFRWFFTFGLIIALSIILSFLVLFDRL